MKPTKPLRIYVAGPYSAKSTRARLRNTNLSIEAALTLWKKGHYPYVPHLTHFVDVRAKRLGIPMTWSDYMAWDDAWLGLCDALVLLDNSRGATLEMEKAKRLSLRIFRSVSEVPTVRRTLVDRSACQSKKGRASQF